MLGSHRPTSQMPYKWCLAGGSMMAQLVGQKNDLLLGIMVPAQSRNKLQMIPLPNPSVN